MKKILAILLALVMVIGVVGCAAPAAEEPAVEEAAVPEAEEVVAEEPADDKMVIGMSCINLSDAGLILIKNGADLAGEDYNCELIWKACEGSLDTQIDQIRGFIQQGVDAIWIDSIDVAGIVDVVNEATEAGIIVLTAGSKVEGEANYNLIYPDYVDSYFAACAVGEYYKDATGTVGLIVGSVGNLVSEKRQQGFTDGLANYPNLKLVTGMGQWDANTSMTVAEDICRSNADLLHMHVIQDGMSYGAYRGIQNAGANITISANDGDGEALDHLEKGEYLIDNVVGNERLGYWGIVIARRLFSGEEMAIDQYLPTYKVMGDDMRALVDAAGLGEIDGTTYSFVTIDEARVIVGADSYRAEFDENFVPTK